MSLKKILIITGILLLLPFSFRAFGGDFGQSSSLFTDIKAHKVGDILTVNIYEDAGALQQAETKAEKTGEFSTSGGPGIGQLDFIPLWSVDGKNENTFDGTSNIIDTGRSGPIRLERGKDLEVEKKRLYKAAREMESVFLYQLLKTMRQTIPEDDSEESNTISGDMGKDIYTQMFDKEIAMKMAGDTDRSIAAQIYRSMVGILEKQAGGESEQTSVVKNLLPNRKYFKMNQLSSPTSKKVASKTKYEAYIEHAAAKYRLHPESIKAVIQTESNFKPTTTSSAGAKGLTQIMDSTATEMGVDNIFSPTQNIGAGERYLG